MKNSQYAVFEINGDVKKDILATAVARAIKKAHPERDLIVVTHHPDVWLHNPHVYRVYRFGNMPYFYDEYIRGRDTELFRHDPYITEDFAYMKKHISEIWCNLYTIPHDSPKPELYLTQREYEIARNLIQRHGGTGKTLLLHTSDAPASVDYKDAWRTSIPTHAAQKIVDHAITRGYSVIHIRRHDEPKLRNTIELSLSLRLTCALLSAVDYTIAIDGYIQVAASALNAPTTTVWIGTDSRVFGYSDHTHISPHISKTLETYIASHPIYISTIDTHEFQLLRKELSESYDVEQIVNTLI